jgi:hypothetical protein
MESSLWAAHFWSSIGRSGQGVITLQDNIASGGSNEFFYLGNYSIDSSNNIKAKILVKNFTEPAHSIFENLNEFTVELSGQCHESQMKLNAVVKEHPEKYFWVLLRKIANL